MPAAERQLAALWRTAVHALGVLDDERRCVRVNEPGARLLRAPVEQIIGRAVDDFTPPELLPRLANLWPQRGHEGPVSGLYEILRADGTRALIEYQTAWRFGAGQHLVAAREIPRHTAVEGPQDVTALQAGRRLTPREQEVLQLAADGSSTVEIAVALVLSPGTVKIHFQHIYEKLGVSGRAWAVAEGLRRGVIR